MKSLLIFTISAVATPLIILLWGTLSPPKEDSSFDSMPDELLYSRNNWIEVTAQLVCFLGIAIPWYYADDWNLDSNKFWAIGLAAGLMVVLPCLFIAIVTLPQGLRRFLEFWRHYERTYGISIKSLTVVYSAISFIGVFSLWKIVT